MSERDARSERIVEHCGDLFMTSLGFNVIRFSQPRASMQTPGIPDRRYYHEAKGIALWWEAKAPGGVQSVYQRQFQVLAESCGETYLLGTDDVLENWAVERGLVRRLSGVGFLRLG